MRAIGIDLGMTGAAWAVAVREGDGPRRAGRDVETVSVAGHPTRPGSEGARHAEVHRVPTAATPSVGVLREIKRAAEQALGEAVTHAAVTVPRSWTAAAA